MKNLDIRAAAKDNGVFIYEIAERLGVSDATMTHFLRRELSEEKKAHINGLISEIAKAHIAAN